MSSECFLSSTYSACVLDTKFIWPELFEVCLALTNIDYHRILIIIKIIIITIIIYGMSSLIIFRHGLIRTYYTNSNRTHQMN